MSLLYNIQSFNLMFLWRELRDLELSKMVVIFFVYPSQPMCQIFYCLPLVRDYLGLRMIIHS